MENKDSHIDQFFEWQLGQIDAQPDQKVMEAIFKHLEHTEHPIDFALDKALSDYTEVPTSHTVLDNLGSDFPIIDIALHRHLKEYEDTPDKKFSFEQTKKKRRALWFVLMMIFISVVSYTILSNKSESLSKKDVSLNYSEKNQTENKKTLTTETQTYPEKNNAFKAGREKSTSSFKLKTKPSAMVNETDEIESKEEFETNETVKFLGVKGITPFEMGLTLDATNLATLKPKSYGPHTKAAPFSFLIQAGIHSEVGQSNNLLSDNQHKDAQALFSEVNGKSRTGTTYGILIDYHISNKLNIGGGFTYSSSSNISSVDYFYTDVPVYDTTGTLRGYLKRPGSKSNHTEAVVKNESRSLFIPITLQYQILRYKKIGLWLGAGTQIALQRQISGQFFDFKSEHLVFNREKFSKGLLPQMQIGFRYPLTDKCQLSAQFQVARQTLTFNIQEAVFKRVEILPTLNFGLVYTPNIRIK